MTRTIQTQTPIRRGGRVAPGRDTRGVSVVLGGVLMFALVLTLLVLFQVTLVPSLNEASEFDHSERVQKDMEAVQANLLSASATGAPEELTVETGLRYPERAFLVNPPPVAGSMTTTPGTVTLEGFFGTDVETMDYWEGTSREYETRSLAFVADYNEFRNAPTVVYEHSTLYNTFDDGAAATIGSGKLVSGNRINLVVLEGDLSTASSRSVTTTIDPVSAPGRTTLLAAIDANPKITITTALSAATWENEILADEPNVERVVSDGDGTVTIVLKPGATYEVRMTKLGVGTGYDPEEPAHYLTIPSDTTRNVTANADGRGKLVVEARDRFNNAVSNATVTFDGRESRFETTDGSDVREDRISVRTDENGRATVWTVNDGSSPVEVNASLGTSPVASGPKHVRFTVVPPTVDSSLFGPHGEGSAIIVFEGISATDGSNSIAFDLNNTLERPVNVTGVRLEYISNLEKTGQGSSSTGTIVDGPTTMTEISVLGGGTRTITAEEGGKPAFFQSAPLGLSEGEVSTVEFTFDRSYVLGPGEAVLTSVTIYYEDGLRGTYSVHVFGQ